MAFFAGLVAVVSADAAYAKTVKIKAGSKAVVYSLFTYSTLTCQGGVRPRVAISVPPSNGQADIGLVSYKVPAGNICAGQTYKMVVVNYVPKPGFKGRDSVGLDVMMDMYSNGIGERSLSNTIEIIIE